MKEVMTTGVIVIEANRAGWDGPAEVLPLGMVTQGRDLNLFWSVAGATDDVLLSLFLLLGRWKNALVPTGGNN